MYTLRNAAFRAGAARPTFSAATASWAAGMRQTTKSSKNAVMTSTLQSRTATSALRTFSTLPIRLEAEKPLEPLDETSQPGVAPNPTLESEEALARARSTQDRPPADLKNSARSIYPDVGKFRKAPLTKSPYRKAVRSEHGIFVHNIAPTVRQEDIADDFGAFGEITHLFRQDRWAIINYATREAVDSAVEAANNTFWHGVRIDVSVRRGSKKEAVKEPRKFTPPPQEPTTHIFIGNLPYDIIDNELNALFLDLKGVTAVRIAVNPNNGKCKGFAHVEFDTIENASLAIESLDNVQIRYRPIRVNFARPYEGQPSKNEDVPKAEAGRGEGQGSGSGFQ